MADADGDSTDTGSSMKRAVTFAPLEVRQLAEQGNFTDSESEGGDDESSPARTGSLAPTPQRERRSSRALREELATAHATVDRVTKQLAHEVANARRVRDDAAELRREFQTALRMTFFFRDRLRSCEREAALTAAANVALRGKLDELGVDADEVLEAAGIAEVAEALDLQGPLPVSVSASVEGVDDVDVDVDDAEAEADAELPAVPRAVRQPMALSRRLLHHHTQRVQAEEAEERPAGFDEWERERFGDAEGPVAENVFAALLESPARPRAADEKSVESVDGHSGRSGSAQETPRQGASQVRGAAPGETDPQAIAAAAEALEQGAGAGGGEGTDEAAAALRARTRAHLVGEAGGGDNPLAPQPVAAPTAEFPSADVAAVYYLAQSQAARREEQRQFALLAAALRQSEASLLQSEAQAGRLCRDIAELQATLERERRLLTQPTAHTNIEYLKNVLLEFLQATVPSERATLLNVICTLLSFSPEEALTVKRHLDREQAGRWWGWG